MADPIAEPSHRHRYHLNDAGTAGTCDCGAEWALPVTARRNWSGYHPSPAYIREVRNARRRERLSLPPWPIGAAWKEEYGA